MDTSESKRDIALKRSIELSERYLKFKLKSHERSCQTQFASLFLTVITPVLLLIPINEQYVKILAAATSAGAAISTGLLSIYGWRETYLRNGYTYHALVSERYLFLTKASDDYANLDEEKAAQKFSKRTEKIYMTEVTDWQAEMQRIKQERPDKENNVINDESK